MSFIDAIVLTAGICQRYTIDKNIGTKRGKTMKQITPEKYVEGFT